MTAALGPYTPGGRYRPDSLNVAVVGEIAANGAPIAVMNDPSPDKGLWMHSRRFGLKQFIPNGFASDWASVPGLAQIRLNPLDRPFTPFGPWVWAAWWHDLLCAVGEDKDFATAIFDEKLREAQQIGVPPHRRWLMVRAVDWFSGGAFRRAADPAEWRKNWRDPKTGDFTEPLHPREAFLKGGALAPQAWAPPV